MQIAESARKHKISDRDIEHAVKHPSGSCRKITTTPGGCSSPDTTGRLLEVVVVPDDDPQRVVHADVLRPKFYDYL